MKFTNINRKFNVGLKNNIKIKHIANIYLSSNQQVTFVTNKNCEFDFVRKNWGYYLTSSINSRLKKFKFKICLVMSFLSRKKFILAVHENKMNQFKIYLKKEKIKILFWI